MVNSAFYRRKLPHLQPAEATFFITFRLFGSIPIPVLNRMRTHFNLVQQGIIERGDLTERERRELLRYETKRQHALADDFLDKNLNAPYWLKQSDIASIVAEAIHFRDERQYELHAY